MKAFVIGSGAREHALCWKLSQSAKVTELYCAPGNPGTAKVAENIAISVDNLQELLKFALDNKIDLTVVGPELPLSLGIVDLFRKNNLNIFGPTQAASQMESSKDFAKEVMTAAEVPTAAYMTFTDRVAAENYCNTRGAPLVLKADGLAAGKGVCVCMDKNQLTDGLKFIFDQIKADKVVIEDFLEGVEASFIVAVSSTQIIPMATSHDYKRLLDDHRGPNTGGMGSISPTPNLTPVQEDWIVDNVIKPTLQELNNRGTPFSGFLYAGLMIAPDGTISVVEFNARMGDPECQSIMRRFNGDLFDLLYFMAKDSSATAEQAGGESLRVDWLPQVAITLVACAEGYPGDVRKGDEILGLEFCDHFADIVIFHGGTTTDDDKLVTAGGRVLSITAVGSSLDEARQRAYRASDMIQYKGKHVRRDIGL